MGWGDRSFQTMSRVFLTSKPAPFAQETGGLVAATITGLSSLARDEFGSGFACVGTLRQFGFDRMKVDRSLIVALDHDQNAGAVLRATIALANALDIPVTAEGIETEAQAEVVRVSGCDALQGYLFSRPISAAQFTEAYFNGKRDLGKGPIRSITWHDSCHQNRASLRAGRHALWPDRSSFPHWSEGHHHHRTATGNGCMRARRRRSPAMAGLPRSTSITAAYPVK